MRDKKGRFVAGISLSEEEKQRKSLEMKAAWVAGKFKNRKPCWSEKRKRLHSKIIKKHWKEGKYLDRPNNTYLHREKHPGWKGGRTVDKHGYILVRNFEKKENPRSTYLTESRVIVARVLGRSLGPNEIVHHINKNRSDNKNNNLLVCTRGYHIYLHAKMRKLENLSREGHL